MKVIPNKGNLTELLAGVTAGLYRFDMCGIIAYIGHQRVELVLVAGLLRLEYRGYDSAGVGVLVPIGGTAAGATKTAASPDEVSKLLTCKKEGRVANLQGALEPQGDLGATIGIAHTRWATHGPPCDRNSHPHSSGSSSSVASDYISVVHNGIIENYQMLTEVLTKRGYVFKSETDTEVIAHLIHYVHTQDPAMAFAVAVKTALNQLVGTFAVAVINAHEPDTLIGARQGSPMVLGVGEGEYFLASDVAAMVEWTKQVVYLDEGKFFCGRI